MSIEHVIKQRKFENEHEKLLINLMFTGDWAYSKSVKRFKAYDLSPEQYNILRILRGQHPQPSTVNLLMERMLNKMSNASRLVEKMRLKGLVDRQKNYNDRRAVDVIITEKGLSLLTEIDTTDIEWTENLFGVSLDDANKLNILLDQLRDITK